MVDSAGANNNKNIRALRQAARTAATYDENLLNQIIQKQLGDDPSGSRGDRSKETFDMAKEVDTETMIAYSVGFPVDSSIEKEIEAGVVSSIGGLEQANYIVLRNHILALWRENVNVWLHRDHAMESIRSVVASHKSLVNSAYSFLLQHGYINFGVAAAIKGVMPPEATKEIDYRFPRSSKGVEGAALQLSDCIGKLERNRQIPSLQFVGLPV